jgi:acetyl esterase/lipase
VSRGKVIPWRWRWAERRSLPGLAVRLAVANAGRPPGITERRLDYGDEAAQHALLVLPDDPAYGSRAPVVFVHGGSWRNGSPRSFRAIGRFFAGRGHPTALVGYRFVPDATFPAQLDDVLSGFAAALPHLGASVDDTPVILAGQSTGGHLAALAAYDVERRARYGIPDERIGGLLCVSAPLDLGVLCPEDSLCPLIEALMGGSSDWSQADPVRFTRGDEPWPVLCVHGARDPLVPVVVAASFVDKLEARQDALAETDGRADAGPTPRLVIEARRYHSELVRIFLDGVESTRIVEDWAAGIGR